MLTQDRRQFTALVGASLMAGPVLAQSRDATPAGFKGKVFVTERGGVRVHTYLAEPAGALVTSHIIETAAGPVLVDGQFVAPSARELRSYLDSLGGTPARVILSHAHPDHWFGFAAAGISAVHTGPLTAKFVTDSGAALVAERKVETTPPRIAGILEAGDQTIGGVTFRFRPVLDTEAPEIMTIELPAAGILIAQDVVYNKVHAVVSRQLDQWVAALRAIETRADMSPAILAGHGEPTVPADLSGLVRYLEAVKPLLAANQGKPDQAAAITAEIARAFPDYRIPPLLTLGLSRALAG